MWCVFVLEPFSSPLCVYVCLFLKKRKNEEAKLHANCEGTNKSSIYIYTHDILYIIAELKRKWIPTIKAVLTNRIIAYLKFKHVSLLKAIHCIVLKATTSFDCFFGLLKKKKPKYN